MAYRLLVTLTLSVPTCGARNMQIPQEPAPSRLLCLDLHEEQGQPTWWACHLKRGRGSVLASSGIIMYLRFYTFPKEKKFSSLQIPNSHDLIFFPGPSLFASLRFGKKKKNLHMSGSGFSWCLWGVLEIWLRAKIEAMEKPVSDHSNSCLRR